MDPRFDSQGGILIVSLTDPLEEFSIVIPFGVSFPRFINGKPLIIPNKARLAFEWEKNVIEQGDWLDSSWASKQRAADLKGVKAS